jgi:hypothetical protein
MTIANDWERWEDRWRAEAAQPADLDAMLARARAARRAMQWWRAVSFAVTAVSVAAVGMALIHAGNAFEAALGLAVGIAIALAWLLDAVERDREGEGESASPEEYLAVRRALCRRRIRFARLGWIVLALELTFLVPWWVGGIKVHGFGLSWLRIQGFWGPLAAVTAFAIWTFVVYGRARRELRGLETAERSEGERET